MLLAALALTAGCMTGGEIGENTAAPPATISTSGDDPRTYAIAASQQAIPGNRVDLLIDGPETYDAMFDAIASATDHVNLETFILADDIIGQRLADALIDRVRHGVQVNVIYDSVGSGMTDDEYFDNLREHGVNLLEYHPVLDPEIWKLENRDHRKILVVDGRIGFTGGLNFTRKYRFHSENAPAEQRFGAGWRDTHIRIEGPAVAEMQRAFLRNWAEHTEGDRVGAANYFPDIAPVGDQAVAIVTAEGGNGQGSPIFDHYVEAVESARERVWIVQAYFIPTDALVDALVRAARRGVDTRLLLPRRTDNGLTVPATRSYYDRLLAAGVRIYEFQESHLHAKTALVDDTWATVGSSNLDTLSLHYNDEINAIILDRDFVEELAVSFENDLGDASEITADEWSERSLWRRLKQRAARLLKPVL